VVEGHALFWAVVRKLNLCPRLPFVPHAPSLVAENVNKSSDSPYLTFLVLLQLVACNYTSIYGGIFRCR
jgi:hypothetical protein